MKTIRGTVPVDADLLRLVREALQACADMPFNATPEQTWKALAKAAGAQVRLELWIKHAEREGVRT
jgi:hypothetical protein